MRDPVTSNSTRESGREATVTQYPVDNMWIVGGQEGVLPRALLHRLERDLALLGRQRAIRACDFVLLRKVILLLGFTRPTSFRIGHDEAARERHAAKPPATMRGNASTEDEPGVPPAVTCRRARGDSSIPSLPTILFGYFRFLGGPHHRWLAVSASGRAFGKGTTVAASAVSPNAASLSPPSRSIASSTIAYRR